MVRPEIRLTQGAFDVPLEIVPDRHLVHPIGVSLGTGTHVLNVAGDSTVTGSLTIPDEILERLDRVRFGVHVRPHRILRQLQQQIVEEVVETLPHFRAGGTTGESLELRCQAGQERFDGFGRHSESLFGDDEVGREHPLNATESNSVTIF